MTFIGFTGGSRRLDGAWAIYPNSTLFKCGNYPDKRFSMSPDEMDRAISLFRPSDTMRSNIEHTAFMAGRAAHIGRVWRDGEMLRGEVAIPAALDDLLTDDERKLSCEFDPASKLIAGLALTTTPRVPEAVLMSAYANFARHDTSQGQYAIQSMHDHACTHGAVCAKANTHMSSRHEATAIQQVHDTCVAHGAICATTAGNRPALFAGDGGKVKTMPTLSERVLAWFTGAGIPVNEETDDTKFVAATAKLAAATGVVPAATNASPASQAQPAAVAFSNPFLPHAAGTPGQPAETEEVRKMRQQLKDLASEQRLRNAQDFAARIVGMNRALPREEIGIAAAYFQASTDDAEHPALVVFTNARAEAQQGTRVEQLEGLYMLRTPHNLTKETLAGAAPGSGASPVLTLFNKERTEAPADGGEGQSGHSKEKLLAMSEVGQSVLSANGKGK